ncbi:hypothetical protein [Haloferula sargassicola]
MSMFQLRLRFFFTKRIFLSVLALGLIFHFAIDGFVKAQIDRIRFPAGWEAAETRVRSLFERRAARVVWLWTLLPASIGWMLAGNAARRFDRLAFSR